MCSYLLCGHYDLSGNTYFVCHSQTTSHCETHICTKSHVLSPFLQTVNKMRAPSPVKIVFPVLANYSKNLWIPELSLARCAENYGEIRKATNLVSLMLQFIHNLQKIVSCTTSPLLPRVRSQQFFFLSCVSDQSSSLWGEPDVSVSTHIYLCLTFSRPPPSTAGIFWFPWNTA